MTWYIFTGTNLDGNRVQGHFRASSEIALLNRLQAANIKNISVAKMPFFQVIRRMFGDFSHYFFPVRKMDLSIFYYQLADMLEVGIPIKQALVVIASHLNHPRLVAILHEVIESLMRGATFSEALWKYQRIFSSSMLQLIALAHTREELVAILRYGDQSTRRMTFISRLLFVILPQVSIFIILSLVLLFLRFHYLPSFYYALSVYRKPIPAVIGTFDALTGLVTVHLLQSIGFVIVTLILCKIIVNFSKNIRLIWHSLLYYFPVVGGVIASIEHERLALLYSALLKDGANVQQCARYSIVIVNNLYFKRRVKKLFNAIQRGESFSNALRYFRVFNSAEAQMVALGAAANSLSKTFGRLYNIAQIVLERKLALSLEFLRFMLYLLNTGLFFFSIYVVETLFFYPGS